MVEVGVGADDAPQTQPVVVNEIGQSCTIQLGVAGIDEDNVPVGEKVDGQQGGGALGHPCAADDVLEFHGDPLRKTEFSSLYTTAGKKQIFSFYPYAKREK